LDGFVGFFVINRGFSPFVGGFLSGNTEKDGNPLKLFF